MGDEALFDPHDVQRLHPVSTAPKRFSGGEQRVEQALAIARRDRDLIGMLPGEGNSKQPCLEPTDGDSAAGHEGEALIVDRLVQQPVEQLAGFGACDSKLRPLLSG